VPRKNIFCDFKDDGIEPLGRKQPTAFLTPTFRLMAPGMSIVTSKFPLHVIRAAAKRARVYVDLDVQSDRIRIKVTGRIPLKEDPRRPGFAAPD
jgi:hypothetical protein